MNLVTIRTENGNNLGIKTEKGILNVTAAMPDIIDSQTIIENGLSELIELKEKVLKGEEACEFLEEDKLNLGPCVIAPSKIVCVGLNYRKHAAESNSEVPTSPILFNKYNNSLAGHKDVITLPRDSEQVDYEAELAIVIGQEAKEVSQEKALDHVFGYCAANDLSARDLQFRSNQWLLGKSLDGFCPIGPYLVTSDEIDNPNQLEISCTVNGEICQKSNTKDMIFHCDEIISYISHYMTLVPGDIILTGTPEGVILGAQESEKNWLKHGDEMVVELEGLGKLMTTISEH